MLNWLFLDMNSYFASVEQQRRPDLRDRPVAVVPVDAESSCCIAASIEAKRCGVRTGTRVADARKLCPQLVTVQAQPGHYVQIHNRIIESVTRFAPVEKIYSIDEWAIRLLGDQRQPHVANQLATQIKNAIRHDVGICLTSSAGIAPTRLLAKIAADLHKPDGLTTLDIPDMPNRLASLKLDDLPGISDGIRARLYHHGVTTIEQLWQQSKSQMREIWNGITGERWWAGFHGIDEPEIVTHRQSMGHAHVLPPDRRSDEGAHAIITRLLHKAAARIRWHGYYANRLHVSVRYAPPRFSSARSNSPHSQQPRQTIKWNDHIDLPTCRDTHAILQHFQRLWDRRPHHVQHNRSGPPTKTSIVLAGLTHESVTPSPLFAGAQHDDKLANAIDRINTRYGSHRIYYAGMHNCRHTMDDKIAFGRVPHEPIKI